MKSRSSLSCRFTAPDRRKRGQVEEMRGRDLDEEKRTGVGRRLQRWQLLKGLESIDQIEEKSEDVRMQL